MDGRRDIDALQAEINTLQTINAELRRMLEEYQLLFSALPIMLWYKDDKNKHIRVNRAAAALEGMSPEDIEGKTAEELYPPEQAAAFLKDDLEVINSKKPKLNILEKHVTPKGETMWLQTSKVPFKNAQGKIIGVIASAMDITKQKVAEEGLKEANERLEKQNQKLQRIQEFIDSTLTNIDEVLNRGGGISEIRSDVKDALRRFRSLE